MAKKKTEDSAIVSAADVKTEAAGKDAAPAGATPAAPKTLSKKVGKLPSKNKRRLPRRQKKAQRKLADAAAKQH